MTLIDISVRLSRSTPVWPGSRPPSVERVSDMARGDACNSSQLAMDVHSGTHVDAPLHFLDGGAPVDTLALDALIGEAVVVDFGDVDAITEELLAAHVPDKTERLLCRTRNSALWGKDDGLFHEDYVALTTGAARWVATRGLRLIGVDYLSVQRFGDSDDTHRALLGAGITIVEGLDLTSAPAGRYDLYCLPLKLGDAEGAPARAVLRPLLPSRS